MSHNFPYRRFPAQTETPQQDRDARRSVGGQSDLYGRPQPTASLAHQQSPPSSTEPPYAAQATDVAMGLLQSYGLDPTDLARLAELPEEMLNLDSLPHLLRQLKERRETTSSSLLSPASASAPLPSRRPDGPHPPAASPSPGASDQWAQIRNRPVQYPLEHILSAAKSRSFGPLSSDWSDRRAHPRPSTPAGTYKHPSGAVKPQRPLSSPSCYTPDYDYQERSADPGKQGRDDQYGRPTHGQPASGRMPSRRYSQPDTAGNYGPGVGRDPHRVRPRVEAQPDPLPHSRADTGQDVGAPTAPSRKEALDFHGTPPGAFPYSCSLCDVTALSVKVWFQHINGSHHADKQLALLQRYPTWDCRMRRKSRFNDQPKDEERPPDPPQTINQNSGPRQDKKMAKKTSKGNSKVVCAKFNGQCVDEVRLRTLMEPFGKIVKVLMFPCLAFVEMGSSEQAKDLEKYYCSNPATVQGQEVTFQISSTFSFLQSSRVLSFTPAPPGEEGFSDLMSIVKRFGAPLYTLALPSQAFVEMKTETDAQKLVDYYAANSLKMNGEVIKVGFSGEYNTLVRVPSAKKYEQEEECVGGGGEGEGGGGGGGGGGEEEASSITKRSRSSSPRSAGSHGDSESHPKRSRRDQLEEKKKKKRRSSSSSHEGQQGSRQRSRSSDSSSHSEEAAGDAATPTGVPSLASAQPEPEAEVGIAAASDPETSEAGPTPDAAEASEEESDIEGMAVIGEDGESLDGDDDEEEEEEEEEEREEEGREESDLKDVNVKGEQGEEEEISCEEQSSGPEAKKLQEMEEESEEPPNFMELLANCITLDELCEEDEDEKDGKKQEEKEEEECNDEDVQEEEESRVICFRNLPSSSFTDAEFVNLVKDHGSAVQYFLAPDRQEGFIQMSSGSEASLASGELGNNPSFKGSVLDLRQTHKYPSLSAGWKVPSDSGPDEEEEEEKEEEPRSSRSSLDSSASVKEVLDSLTSGPAETIPQPTGTEESTPVGPEEEEESPLSRKCSSEEQEVPCQEESPPQEVAGLEDVVSEPGDEDQKKPVEESVGKTEPSPDGQTTQTDQNSEDGCQADVETEQNAAERLGQPGGSEEPPKPTKPIGTEFVRPVVGYYCNLCEVIYVDEDEAKTKHCSSPSHYQRYKEHTGQDPWST